MSHLERLQVCIYTFAFSTGYHLNIVMKHVSFYADVLEIRTNREMVISRAVRTCCVMGRIYLRGKGWNLFWLRKSYKFCSSISNTRQVWFLCEGVKQNKKNCEEKSKIIRGPCVTFHWKGKKFLEYELDILKIRYWSFLCNKKTWQNKVKVLPVLTFLLYNTTKINFPKNLPVGDVNNLIFICLSLFSFQWCINYGRRNNLDFSPSRDHRAVVWRCLLLSLP